MKVLVACEFSGTVRDAFRSRGHDAISCDLLPTEREGPHYQGDVRDVLGQDWDLLIAHPPCTYLSSSGLHWNKRTPGRAELTEQAVEFARMLIDAAHIPHRVTPTILAQVQARAESNVKNGLHPNVAAARAVSWALCAIHPEPPEAA